MNGPQTGAGEHRHHGLGDHGHIEDHPIALVNAERPETAGKPCYPIEELGIGNSLHGVGDRAVIDESNLFGSSFGDVPVQCVETRVELAIAEPAVEGRV